MLVQHFSRTVPERNAWIRRSSVIHPNFAITSLALHGIAQDWGAQAELVSFFARLRRVQLCILLEGRGYMVQPQRTLLLTPGDAVESDQLLQQPEGYYGTPAEVLMVEWDEDGPFFTRERGHSLHWRLALVDVARLRRHTARLSRTPVERWVDELFTLLRGLGVVVAVEREALAQGDHAGVVDAMGEALSNLAVQPSMTEFATALGVSERQARRRFADFTRTFGQDYDGWRGFINDARLGWTTQLLSLPGLTLARVAELAGFGSPVALSHAFSLRSTTTPGAMARDLRDRWH
jgi:AraC-like DNA-binding protein